MGNDFDRKLEQLNDELVEMGNLIEKAIEMAISSMVNQDAEIAQKTIEFDAEIDHQEKDIENLCLKLLLRNQPVARDFRTISAILKMMTDMERIGDQASDIAEIVLLLTNEKYIKKLDHIKQMAKETSVMVVNSINAFIVRDVELCESVIAQDDVVDDLFSSVKKELINLIHENPDNGEQATDLLMIAKYFERIGDHATNIAEWAMYAIKGVHKDYQNK